MIKSPSSFSPVINGFGLSPGFLDPLDIVPNIAYKVLGRNGEDICWLINLSIVVIKLPNCRICGKPHRYAPI